MSLEIAALMLLGIPLTWAQNQTDDFSPVQFPSSLPYRVELRPYSFGDTELPTLHSFAAGHYDGKWLFISGRTNGLHGFESINSEENFPVQHQNREVWVIDPVTKQSWHRPLDDASSGLTEMQVLSLSTTNNQFHQSGDSLFITGGYGVNDQGSFITFDTLSAINLPGLGDWVINGNGSAAQQIKQIHDPLFTVTGGAMYAIDGRTHLVFGQDFTGTYATESNGVYTRQVRSFNISYDGDNLSVDTITRNPEPPGPFEGEDPYRRRDLNVFPVLRPDGMGGVEKGLVALSGVFTIFEGAWTVPVEIDSLGNPTMEDPNSPNTFKQAMNNYHSAKVGLFSEASGEMHELLLGGISLYYFDSNTQNFEPDFNLPFVSDMTAVVIDASGNYTQHYLGQYPELLDMSNMPLRFGANAEFMLAQGIEAFDNGVINFDELTAGETVLGYVYGGIETNAPHRFSPGSQSSASNFVFEVILIQVPEPASWILASVALLGLTAKFRSLRSRAN